MSVVRHARPRTPNEVFARDREEADSAWFAHAFGCRACREAPTFAAACPEGRALFRAATEALADYLFFVHGKGGLS
jgi:hypothetical protein